MVGLDWIKLGDDYNIKISQSILIRYISSCFYLKSEPLVLHFKKK